MAATPRPEIGVLEHVQVKEDDIQTHVSYLVRDQKHDEEKPYELAYHAAGVIPDTNMSYEKYPVLIRNFRPFQHSDCFDQYGFTSAKVSCMLTSTDFHDE